VLSAWHATQVNVWQAENLYTHVEADNEVGLERGMLLDCHETGP